ncbi:hypothetical protein O181_008159 [Austropuccinia psidii MF-1]|uniref:Uncharacterized protein n=1 Tax=Austropuccinia psidii MF-1 TaxID=1389203 RepID=A0A9Q3GIL1_9BASI|nr:hypothetical protein [Austropuccinia psidii MF-1]
MGVQNRTPEEFLNKYIVLNPFLQSHTERTHKLTLCLYTKEDNLVQLISDKELSEDRNKFKSMINKMMGNETLTNKLKNPIETIKLFPIEPWRQTHPVFN